MLNYVYILAYFLAIFMDFIILLVLVRILRRRFYKRKFFNKKYMTNNNEIGEISDNGFREFQDF